MMYHNPQAVVLVNGRRSRVFALVRSARQGCPLSPLLYVLALEPLLRRLRDEGIGPALRGGPLTARVSAFADDITVFVSRRLGIKAVKEAVVEYERIAGAKVNFDKSEGWRLGAWRGSNTLPGPFRWSDGSVRILAGFGITSGSGRLASNPSSSYCSTLVTSWTTFFLRFRVRSVWCFSRSKL